MVWLVCSGGTLLSAFHLHSHYEKKFTKPFLSPNSINEIALDFMTGHMVYNLAYINILQKKETKHTEESSVRLFYALDIGLLG